MATSRLATRRLLVLAAGVAAFMVVALGVAWACTPQAGVTGASPDTAEPGTDVTVRGNEYRPDAPIEFRWGARTGPVVGETTTDATGSFTGTATIPADAEARETLLYAVESSASVGGEGAVMIRVLGEDEPAPTPEPETTNEPEPAPAPETADEAEPAQGSTDEAPEPEPAEQAAPSTSEGERQQIGGQPQQTEGEPQQVGGEPQPAGGERQQVGATAPSAGGATAEPAPTASAAPADPAPAEAAPAQPAPADPAPAEEPAAESAEREASVETSGPVSLGPDQVDRGNAAAPQAAPSERSAGGDLWSGVAPSEAPSLTPEAGYDSAAEAGQTGPGQFAVGLALFGAGLTVLLAGAGVPALRRRRALAQAHATRSD